jgi:hypothetical protein
LKKRAGRNAAAPLIEHSSRRNAQRAIVRKLTQFSQRAF